MYPQLCFNWASLLCILGILIVPSQATVHDVLEVMDLSNLDLIKFEYFKNFPSQNPRMIPPGQVNHVLEHFQKKKAFLDYFEHLFFGLSPFTPESDIPFDPNFGRAWRPHFVRKYGWKGERLVEALGKGYSLEQLRLYGAIPNEFGKGHYATR